MWSQYLPRFVPLVLVVLLAACSGSSDEAADTTVAPTTTITPSSTTTPPSEDPTTAAARAAGGTLDFAQHDVCEWFAGDEVLGFIRSAYEQEGVDWAIPASLEGRSDAEGVCRWNPPGSGHGYWGIVYVMPTKQNPEDVPPVPMPLLDPPAAWSQSWTHSSPEEITKTGVAAIEGQGLVEIGHTMNPLPPDAEVEVDGIPISERVLLRITNSILHGMNWLQRINK